MPLRIVTESTRRCGDCGEPLPKIASKLFAENDGCCPRCAFIHGINLSFDSCEIRNMALRGRSSIAVPRIEFHKPGNQPRNAVPA